MKSLRNEIAKRYTPVDWIKSKRVSRYMDLDNSDKFISDALLSRAPALVGRLGGTEARFIGEYIKLKRMSKLFRLSMNQTEKFSFRWKKRKKEILNNAGFYPRDWNSIEIFVNLYLDALKSIDVLGAWGTAFGWPESFALEQAKMPKVTLIDYTAPWVMPRGNFAESSTAPIQQPWSLALHGKKVLVVSGFSKSILSQYPKMQLIFPDFRVPSFELQVINVPLMQGVTKVEGKFWIEVLDELKMTMSQFDFDVALVSAGAFSLPLAHHAKNLGKVGIHAGGALQLFFGIMGRRWESYPEVTGLLNDYWIRPSQGERPKNAETIEGACYW